MKNLIFPILLICSCCFWACESDDDAGLSLVYDVCTDTQLMLLENSVQSNLNIEEIPANIRSYMAGNFPGFELSTARSIEDASGNNYIEIKTSSNGILLFDTEGNFICGDSSFQSAGDYDDDDYEDEYDEEYINPDDLPQNILDYIAQNYPNASIYEVELEDGEYEIELDNDIELCFDLQGNFLGEDC